MELDPQREQALVVDEVDQPARARAGSDRKLKSLAGLRSVTRSLRNETCMVASSRSMPRCQPNRGWRSRKPAPQAGAGRAVVLARRRWPAPRLDGPKPTPTMSSTGHDGAVGGSAAASIDADQAAGAHVGPVRFDVGEARLAGVAVVDDRPPGGDGGERRPQRVLALVVDQDEERAVGVVERVGHRGILARYGRMLGSPISSSLARLSDRLLSRQVRSQGRNVERRRRDEP